MSDASDDMEYYSDECYEEDELNLHGQVEFLKTRLSITRLELARSIDKYKTLEEKFLELKNRLDSIQQGTLMLIERVKQIDIRTSL